MQIRNLKRTSMLIVAAAIAALAVAVAGCGEKSSGGSSSYEVAPSHPRSTASAAPARAGRSQAFAWLRPSPSPRAWQMQSLPGGAARLAYPSPWHAIESDPGTVSAAVQEKSGEILGYLNATPRQGDETLANWSRFRPAHNRDEGDLHVRLVASATNLRFKGGHGSCVIDTYASVTGRAYREIACIVAGARATTVVVGAAPPAQWQRRGPAIERSISTFLT